MSILKNIDYNIIFSFLMASLILLATAGAFTGSAVDDAVSDAGIRVEIEDEEEKKEIFVNTTEEFRIDIAGTFDFEGERMDVEDADNWTLEVYAEAEATIQPERTTSNETTEFTVDVTIHELGETTLNFTAFCTKEDETRYSERHFDLKVVRPQTLSFEVNNPTSYEIEEVKLKLYINSELRKTDTITGLEANETRRVHLNWSRTGLDSGEHELEVKADYGIGSEKSLLTDSFYIEDESNALLYGSIAAVIIAIGVLVFLYYRRKKKRKRRPW